MRIIELDASSWTKVIDFYNALNTVFGAEEGYASSLDGLLELLVWDHAFPNTAYVISPPYTIRIQKTKTLSKDILDEIDLIIRYLLEAREEFRIRRGHDINVNMEIVS